MKTFLPVLIFGAVCCAVRAQAPAPVVVPDVAKINAHVGKEGAMRQIIAGWGVAVDPDGDCGFAIEDGAVVITVPGGQFPHDLGAELNNTNAPRVLREVSGDFMLEVRVDGDFNPGGKSTQPGRTGYTGAGLVAFADNKNYVRIERATLQGSEKSVRRHYGNFEVRIDGKVQRFGQTNDLPLEDNQPVYLRLIRRGAKMYGAVSHDGKEWKEGEPKDIGADWPDKLLVGVAAISTSVRPFTPYYSDFRASEAPKLPVEKE
jgi:hypothetical protein